MNGPMFYQWIFQHFDTLITHYISGTVERVAASIGPVAVTLFGIYILLWAYAYLTNRIEEPVMDGTKRLVMIAVILAFALNAGGYSAYMVNFVQKTPVAMANVVAAGGSTATNKQSTAKLLDGMLGQGFTLGAKARDKAGVLHGDFGMYFVAICIYASTVIVTLFAAFLLLMAQVAMAVLLVLGPIFLLLLMFNATKRYFELWLGSLVNYMLTYVMTIAVVSLFFGFIATYLTDMLAHPGVNSFSDTAELVAVCGISGLVLRQVPSIASGIAGGIGLSTLGGFGAAMNPLRRVAGGVGNVGRQGVNAGARRAGSAAWNSRAGTAARRGMANAFRRKNSIHRI